MVVIKLRESILKSFARAFDRIPLAPLLARERPADLETGPAIGIQKTESPDHVPARLLLDGPVAVAAQVKVADQERHVPPRFEARERLTSEVTHHFGVGADFCVGVD